MRTPLVTLACALGLAALALPAVQERVKKKEPKDFKELVAGATRAWEGGHYSVCSAQLREALALCSNKHREAIRAAFPTVEGWTLQELKEQDDASAAIAMSFVGGGTLVDGEWREEGGRGRMNVNVMAGSPLAQMFSMWIANPATLGPDAELIKYDAYNAVLRTQKEGSRYEMQLLIGDDLVQISLNGADDDFLLKAWSQAVVDRLAAALAN